MGSLPSDSSPLLMRGIPGVCTMGGCGEGLGRGEGLGEGAGEGEGLGEGEGEGEGLGEGGLGGTAPPPPSCGGGMMALCRPSDRRSL